VLSPWLLLLPQVLMKRHFLSKPMPLVEAARELGIGSDESAARRLAYMIRKRERETGKKILIGGGRGVKLMVTVAALRKHFDDLVDDRSYLARIVDEAMSEFQDDIAALKMRDKALAAEIRELKKLAKRCEASR
jgi:hypothetical protein